jgi:hypothetical protein
VRGVVGPRYIQLNVHETMIQVLVGFNSSGMPKRFLASEYPLITFAEIVGQENVIAGTDCGLGGRVHPQIAWPKLRALRDGAAIASKKLWS